MFTIRFRTVAYRPDLQVTLRNNVDGWDEDIPGEYEDDAWRFRLPVARYAGGMAFKFVLEEQYWMFGGDLFVDPVEGGDYVYAAPQVQFPPMGEVVKENSLVQQRFFIPNLDGAHVYDVIVIGSGIGGGVLADQLSDSGLDTLVLEIGSYLFPTHVGNLPRQHTLQPVVDKNIWSLWDDFKVTNYVNAPGSAYAGAQGFNLGGRSLFWGAFIPRMTWWELDTWPQPVRWDLEDYAFDLAQELLKRSILGSAYQQQVISGLRPVLPEYVVQTAPMAIQHTDPIRRGVPGGVFSTADLLMESRLTGSGVGAEHLTINLNHAVVNIETAAGNATGVVAYDLIADKVRTYKGRAIVIAAGTVESAKLALLSGLNDPNGKLGGGITDHPIFFTHFAVPASSPYFDSGAGAKLMLRHENAGLATPPPHVGDHRFNCVLELGADFNQGRFVDPDILEAHRQAKGNMMLAEIVFLLNAPLLEGNRLVQPGPSYVKPVITMAEVPITAAEWAQISDLQQRVIAEVQGIPLAGNDLIPDRAALGGVAHEVGTLRMGTDAASNYQDGVVDANLKFLSYDNLYACDLSVFPSSPAANPTLTLAALAFRLARHLRSVL